MPTFDIEQCTRTCPLQKQSTILIKEVMLCRSIQLISLRIDIGSGELGIQQNSTTIGYSLTKVGSNIC